MNNQGLNFGRLIFALEFLKSETIIRFDFGCFTPQGFHSYRGYYEDIGIGYTDQVYDRLTAGQFVGQCRDFLKNGELHGYKGGEFKPRLESSVWVSKDSSECSGTIITGIRDLGYGYAIIETKYED